MSDLSLVTAPTDTPVSMIEAKAHLRETIDDNNAEILLKLKAAADYFQQRIPFPRQSVLPLKATHLFPASLCYFEHLTVYQSRCTDCRS
ncbi:hypothetical protein LCGC14_2704940 [marine sediment metagenome]|uniref:Uncharacterized protein n=1 Tax=marine sediment metagenome TaxID=412755 RepID=A0A0F8ZEI0_9ZZZZ